MFDLDWANKLIDIPRQLISNFSKLQVLRMFGTGFFAFYQAPDNTILPGEGEVLAEELLGLKHLEVLEFTLTSSMLSKLF